MGEGAAGETEKGEDAVTKMEISKRATSIADEVVPQYRHGSRIYRCHGTTAARWQAAWDGACLALGGDPADFRNAL